MIRAFCAAVLLTGAAAVVVAAQSEKPRGEEILRAAQQAARELDVLSYQCEVQTEGALARMIPADQGEILLGRPKDAAGYPRLRILRAGEAGQLDIFSDGSTITLVDDMEQAFTSREGKRAGSVLFREGRVALWDIVQDHPYHKDLMGGDASYEGTAEVDGVTCDIVSIKRNSVEVRWYFGQEDRMPRKLERIISEEVGGGGRLVMTLSNVKVNPPVNEFDFIFSPPPGYEEVAGNRMAGEPRRIQPDEVQKPTRRQPSSGRGPTQIERVSPEALEVGSDAPPWALKTFDEETRSLAEHRGKVVVLDFWATWCRPCREAMRDLQKLHEHYQGRPVAVYGVNVWERGEPKKFIETTGYTYPNLEQGDEIVGKYRISALPTVYVIGPDGKILFRNIGRANPERLKSVIDAALEKIDRKAEKKVG